MTITKKLFGATLLSFALASSLAQAQERTIRFGSDATYPPFESTTPLSLIHISEPTRLL